MTSSDSQLPPGKGQSRAVTEVQCVDDLHAALTDILASQSNAAVYELEGILGSIKRDFESASVTMTSTNIPDAVTKLSAVLVQTSKAATRVFELVERQKVLLADNESSLNALEQLVREAPTDTEGVQQVLSKVKSTQLALGEMAHEIVMAQEYQDLCSQNIEKVMRFIGKLDGDLRALLAHFKMTPSVDAGPESSLNNPDIGQGDADEILTGFGM